ncbi:MAG: isopenicillin N synthase family dioxygenase [Leptothrix sp. (in: b-proteobacteria)]
MHTDLPIIDLAASFGTDPQGARDAARAIDAACREHGFFYVSGHGVPLALLSHVFMHNRRLFELPEPVKNQWHIERSGGLKRGFDPIGWQALEPGRPADLKESFYLGTERGPDDPLVRAGTPNHGPNQWPAEALLPGFRATCEAYSAALAQLARHLMGLMALGLGLPRNHFEPYLRNPMPVLRLLHYPPQAASQLEGQIGSGAHTDWGGITLLAQDHAGGLQVQSRDGRWLDARPIEGAFVVNLGDLMQRWTNDAYRSTLHRVVNQASGRDRHSIAYFYDIDYHAQVSALPTCHSATNPPRHAPITAGEHVVEMYRRTTLAMAGDLAPTPDGIDLVH